MDGDKTRYPFLAAAGIDPEDENFFNEALRKIHDLKLDYTFLSNGLVLELWGKVEIQRNPKKRISWAKISRREFSHIVGSFLFKWDSDCEVRGDFIKKASYPRELEKMSRDVGSGLLSKHQLWKTGISLLSHAGRSNQRKKTKSINIVTKDECEMEGLEDEIDTIEQQGVTRDQLNMKDVKELPHLIKSGLIDQDSTDDICFMMKLKSWNPTSGVVTNGLMIEVEENFGREARSILCDKIFDILGIHESQRSRFLKCRFSKYIARTSSKLVKEEKLLESSWFYLEKLDSGGENHDEKLLKPICKFDNLAHKIGQPLQSNGLGKFCSECGEKANFCCRECFSVFYCSTSCQENSWLTRHFDECRKVSLQILGEETKHPPEPELDLKKEIKKTVKLLEKSEAENKQLRAINDDNEEKLLQKNAENFMLKNGLAKVCKANAGKSSAFSKLKSKPEKMEDIEIDEYENTPIVASKPKKTQTRISINNSSHSILGISEKLETGNRNLEVYVGKELDGDEKRPYGESLYVRLPSSRDTWPNDKVVTKVIQNRAFSVKDFVSLISGAYELPLDEASKVESLLWTQLGTPSK